MKKILIGKYQHKDSIVHRLNPITKFIITLVLLIFIGIRFSYVSLVSYFIITLAFAKLSKLSITELFSLLKPFRFLLIFTFVIQLFYDNHNQVVNIENAFFYTTKFIFMITISGIFTITTKPIDIVKIVYKIVTPLKVLRLNPLEIATSSIIALRFIPLIFEEADKIFTAQKLRGVMPNKGIKLLFSLHTFIIPLFNRVIYFAEQISVTLSYRKNWEHMLVLKRINLNDLIIITATILGCYGIFVVQ